MNTLQEFYQNFNIISRDFLNVNFIQQPNKYKLRNMIVLFMIYAKMVTIVTYLFNTIKLIPYLVYTFSFTSFSLGYLLCIAYPISKEEVSEHCQTISYSVSDKLDKYYHLCINKSIYGYNTICISCLNKINIDSKNKIYKLLVIKYDKMDDSSQNESTQPITKDNDDKTYRLRSRYISPDSRPSVHFDNDSKDD